MNIELLNEHTIALLNGTFFNAQGKTILNVADGARAMDAVNLSQLEDATQYAKSEMYKLVKVFQRRWEKLVSYNYKLHTQTARSSLGAEEAELLLANQAETRELIQDLDTTVKEKKDWRSVYESS